MELPNPSLPDLFAQLGLESDEASIEAFIANHSLPDGIKLIDAEFWTPAQAQLLKEKLRSDDDWALVVDELNERLHLPPV
ncbi:DUF2789 domain-containing protein [Pseudomonas sp. 21LCFQ02]|uniref:DUF2789 domain-containing protein n=1 Tax=unclassified Pseudomonas TaxID=196821 RepID=UPI0004F6D8E8|nr:MULTISPECIES: DUF2789 domain-containing protein [unclassified Pseudomonas]MCO8160672.1 DUF2789 domain-containing protein [Pseudomonas sp. 21LCFQ010]MCO8170160.1 DUF2789 domain-containing protein [Pseudomonas sp. 21LCFQ02]MCQ9426570.1 DUF2789 domain-containing protein [Pseudomonas sp. LJDD11]BAP44443.1 hypothetical protein PSCI_3741 [Pseudomonas sp. StFLB209]